MDDVYLKQAVDCLLVMWRSDYYVDVYDFNLFMDRRLEVLLCGGKEETRRYGLGKSHLRVL